MSEEFLNNPDIIFPEVIKTIEQKDRLKSEWIENVKKYGKGFLHGKFKSEWFDPDVSSLPEMPKEEPVGFEAAFRDMGLFGLEDAQDTNIIAAIPNRILTAELDLRTPVNNLIASRPLANAAFEKLGIRPDQRWRVFTYHMLQHWKYSPIGGFRGGNHIPLEFELFLPRDLSGKLSTDVLSNPRLIEDIYVGMYPGLNNKGLQRVQTSKLRLCQLPKNDMTQQEAQLFVGDVKNFREMQFDKIVGELPS